MDHRAVAPYPDLETAAARLGAAPVTRYAPSPTGYLHLGHVVNAVYVWGLAEALGGSIHVRIEDHDRLRCRPQFEAALLEDLEWLGFLDLPATAPERWRQSERGPVYGAALERLQRVHHVYACDCSRSRIGGGRYSGRCRDRQLRPGRGAGLRVRLDPGGERFDDLLLGPQEQHPTEQCGDMLIRDRDGHWTYHFAVTIDDLDQHVTLVVRGADLLSSTGRQLRLARLLTAAGAAPPAEGPVYLHHPIVHDEHGRKLSKSTHATGIRELRRQGLYPAEVIGRAAAAAGLLARPRPLRAADVGQLFACVQREAAQRDPDMCARGAGPAPP